MENNNKSFFIIKPEAFDQKEEIKKIITNHTGLTTETSKVVTLNEQDIDALYLDDIGTELMKAIKAQLIGAVVEAGIVVGENAVIKLTQVCGEHPFPNNCNEGTIRKQFGRSQPIINSGIVYYLNAIHKASKKEANPSIEWFYSKK